VRLEKWSLYGHLLTLLVTVLIASPAKGQGFKIQPSATPEFSGHYPLSAGARGEVLIAGRDFFISGTHKPESGRDAVPEPSALVLLGTGLLAVAGLGGRKVKKTKP